MFVTGIFPPDIGGPASYVPRIGAALAKNHEVSVVSLGDPHPRDETYPFKLIRIPRKGNVWMRRFRTMIQIRKMASKVEVVIANGLYFETALALPRSTPAVAKVVGDTVWERARNSGETDLNCDDFQNEHGTLRLGAMHNLQSYCINAFRKVFTPSNYLKGIVQQWGVTSEKLSVIPNAVEVPPNGDQHPEVDVVCVSRLVPWKGIMEIVQLATQEEWSLTLVGDGPIRSEIEAYLKDHANTKIELRGAVAAGQVADEIRRGRVFVLNSSYEGLPHVVLEAQAAGVPVVATRAGGTPECIEDGVTGSLVDVGNIDQMREAVAALLGNKLLRNNIAEAALVRIQSDFSFSQMVERTEDLLVCAVDAG